MTQEELLRKLEVPKGKIDVILDTDAFNEIDDQYAISYMLRNKDRLNTRALYAAPFFNTNSTGPKDGMIKSYDEIFKVLDLLDEEVDVFKGSEDYLPDENTYIDSPAARDLVRRAKEYSLDKPLYVVAIGAITNIASALIMDPSIKDKIVVVWLGGHGYHYHDTQEFNMRQDFAAARVVMGSGVPFVQLPCMGVVSEFSISGAELDVWLKDKNKIADYLARNTIETAEEYASGTPWTRIIWDVTAVAWLLNDDERFMKTSVAKVRLPEYSGVYSDKEEDIMMRYVYYINRDALMKDLIESLLK